MFYNLNFFANDLKDQDTCTVIEHFQRNKLTIISRISFVPPPYPRSGKSFCQKTLSGNGPPPPLTESRKKIFKKWVKKG